VCGYTKHVSTKYDFRQMPAMRLLRALVEAHAEVMEGGEAQIRGYGLSSSEFDCLVTLGVDQPLRMCDLASRTLTTKSHTTQVMKQLEGRGLARRERSRESDREVLASLTPEGQALFEQVYPTHYEFLRDGFGRRLDERETRELTLLLRKLAGKE
jgi:MarR family transcriptional regulator, 2-MHQ and catechol-resistance regulon repressor